MRHGNRIILSVAGMLFALSAAGWCADLSEHMQQAMEQLSLQRGASSMCVLTNAGYVNVDGQTTIGAVDDIQEITGCTAGSGRLLFYHRSTDKPLQVALFDKNTSRCVVITRTASETSMSNVADIGLERLGDETAWNGIRDTLGADVSTIVGFAHLWAAGAPYDFMKCAEFHNHLCPGVTSGYFIANYIQQNLIPEGGASCTFIACPVWCKDDAIQVLLDLTAGKKSLVAKHLSDEQLSMLKDDTVAGVLLVNGQNGEGATAHILGFDWDAADELAGAPRGTGMAARIRNLAGLIPYYGTPEALVSVLDTRQVSSGDVALMTAAGVNPYEILHFMK